MTLKYIIHFFPIPKYTNIVYHHSPNLLTGYFFKLFTFCPDKVDNLAGTYSYRNSIIIKLEEKLIHNLVLFYFNAGHFSEIL
jgi:hypothetical protein